MMQRQASQVVVDVAMALCPETVAKPGSDGYQSMTALIQKLMQNLITYEEAVRECTTLAGTPQPIEKVHEILTVPVEPIPFDEPHSPIDESNPRKKSRNWTPYEDTRLIAGIYKYGIDNWTSISLFVGNGRTRSQCSQRWQRGLDPHLSKDHWTAQEESYLLHLVQCYGDKAWTQIAAKMGNRSDVQCRYRFKQMQKDCTLHAKSLAGGQYWHSLRKTQSSVMTPHPIFPVQSFGYIPPYNPMLSHPSPFRMAMMAQQNGGVRSSLSVPTIQFQPIPGLAGMVVKELPQQPMEAVPMMQPLMQAPQVPPPPAPPGPESKLVSGRPSISDLNFDNEFLDDIFNEGGQVAARPAQPTGGTKTIFDIPDRADEGGGQDGMFDPDAFSVF